MSMETLVNNTSLREAHYFLELYFKVVLLENITKMTNISNHDIDYIRDWMAKEDHMPKDFTNTMIKKFLHSCYGSLEQTKQCIEKFCEARLNMSEVFNNRDPMSPKIQTALSITSLSIYKAGDDELLIYQIDDPTLDNYEFYPAVKAFSLLSDYWIEYPVYAERHIVLLDMQHFFLKLIPKLNIFLLRQFFLYLLEAMPVRLQEVHAFNCPPYYEKLYALVKPVLPPEICDMLHFYPTIEDVHKVIDKKHLPKDLGGEAEGIRQQMADLINKLEELRNTYLDDNRWKAIPTKKSKPVENGMSGSFRTLSID